MSLFSVYCYSTLILLILVNIRTIKGYTKNSLSDIAVHTSYKTQWKLMEETIMKERKMNFTVCILQIRAYR